MHTLLSPHNLRMYIFLFAHLQLSSPKIFLFRKDTGQAFAPSPTFAPLMPSVVDINIKSYQHLEVLLKLRIFILALSNYNGQFLTIELYQLRNHDSVFCKLHIKVYSRPLLSIYVL